MPLDNTESTTFFLQDTPLLITRAAHHYGEGGHKPLTVNRQPRAGGGGIALL